VEEVSSTTGVDVANCQDEEGTVEEWTIATGEDEAGVEVTGAEKLRSTPAIEDSML